MISSISMVDFLKIEVPIQVIDIRSVESYNNNHIPGARNVPFEKLLVNPNKYLNKNETYYIYCQKGTKSLRICQMLGRMGYRVINVIGGYESWVLER